MKEHLGYGLRKGKGPRAEKQKMCPDCGKIVKYQMSLHLKNCKKSLDKLVIPDDLPPSIPVIAELLSSPPKQQHGDASQVNVKHSEKTLIATGYKVNQSQYSCEKCDNIFKKQA